MASLKRSSQGHSPGVFRGGLFFCNLWRAVSSIWAQVVVRSWLLMAVGLRLTFLRWLWEGRDFCSFIYPYLLHSPRQDGGCWSCWILIMILISLWIFFFNHLEKTLPLQNGYYLFGFLFQGDLMRSYNHFWQILLITRCNDILGVA